ncbi:MAG: ABC transporter substrate-binding protein [Alphaproteobacteria bacterium]|nr:ABC transporter substrate-binding protein [Alphaproteobacteria bacterium]
MPAWRQIRNLAAMAMVLALAAGPASASDVRPSRVVSINLCADQLLLLLAEPERIRSLSYYALDPGESYYADRARTFHINHVTADEVLALEPDLVLAGVYTTRSTVGMLRRKGVRVVELAEPRSIDDIRTQFLKVAELLGVRERGEALLAEMMQRIKVVASRNEGPKPLAAIYFANGLTAGKGTLINDVMRMAGIENLAGRFGIEGFGNLSLERLLISQPDMIILDHDTPERPSLAGMALRHPAFRYLQGQTKTVSVPRRIWTCWGPFTAEWVEHLAEAKP